MGFGLKTIVKVVFPVRAIAKKFEDEKKEELSRDDRVDQILEQIAFERRPQLSSEFLAGELIAVGTGADKKNRTAIALDATKTVLVPHKLEREYQGWHVVWQDADATIYEDLNSNVGREQFLPLKCSANVNVRLLVF